MESIENLLFRANDYGRGTIYYTPKWCIPLGGEKPTQYEFRDVVNSICNDFYKKYKMGKKDAVIIADNNLMSSLTGMMLVFMEDRARHDSKERGIDKDYAVAISNINVTIIKKLENPKLPAS